jgi:NitT/TauT family transport system substrate-binding protein
MQCGLFAKHGLELQVFYTSGGGETQQAVISGSADIGVSPGTLGVLGAFAKGAPVRIIAGEATGTAEYYFVKADSAVQKDFKGVKPDMTLAYSTAGSGTHITALRFMKEYGFSAKLTATGNVPATFTSVMTGQVDIGFSTPPFGLDALAEGRARLIALANDLPSVRNQTVRLIIANATDLTKRREVYDRFIKAYREVIDWMYSDPRAIEAFAKYASIPPATAQKVRDEFYPKSMLQLDDVKGMPELMQDAIAFKYIPAALGQAQLDELLQLPRK